MIPSPKGADRHELCRFFFFLKKRKDTTELSNGIDQQPSRIEALWAISLGFFNMV